jgi:hypothetical protein
VRKKRRSVPAAAARMTVCGDVRPVGEAMLLQRNVITILLRSATKTNRGLTERACQLGPHFRGYRGEPCSTEATKWFKKFASGTVRVDRGPRADDNHGRILFYIFTDDGESVGEILVREGIALAWTRDGQHLGVLVLAENGPRRDRGWSVG